MPAAFIFSHLQYYFIFIVVSYNDAWELSTVPEVYRSRIP